MFHVSRRSAALPLLSLLAAALAFAAAQARALARAADAPALFLLPALYAFPRGAKEELRRAGRSRPGRPPRPPTLQPRASADVYEMVLTWPPPLAYRRTQVGNRGWAGQLREAASSLTRPAPFLFARRIT